MQPVATLNIHRLTGRAAFTLIEVMIAVAVLAIGMFSVLSTIPMLSSTRKLALEMVMVRQIAESFTERIQGASWSDLGGNATLIPNENAWSLPRYNTTITPMNVPLSENAAAAKDDIQKTGVLTQLSGIANLKIYLEYYTGDIMATATDRTTFYNAISGSTGVGNRLTDFSASNQLTRTVIVRILITWNEDQANAPRNRHELFVARKQ